jgi:hypothetical protein
MMMDKFHSKAATIFQILRQICTATNSSLITVQGLPELEMWSNPARVEEISRDLEVDTRTIFWQDGRNSATFTVYPKANTGICRRDSLTS